MELIDLIQEDAFRKKDFILNDTIEKRYNDLYTILILELQHISQKKLNNKKIYASVLNFFTIYGEMAEINPTLTEIVNEELENMLEKYIDFLHNTENYNILFNYEKFINILNIMIENYESTNEPN